MSWNVLITSRAMPEVGAAALDLLHRAGCRTHFPSHFGPFTPDELRSLLRGKDAVLAGSDMFSRAVLADPELAQLKIISRWGVGYDAVDIKAATEHGIVIAYTPGLLNEAVADYTFSLLLSIARRIPQADAAMRGARWSQQWGHDIFGKTLGIVGFGRIGQAVARRAAGFSMRILAFDVASIAHSSPVAFVSLEELLAQSDFVSLHSSLTPLNRGFMNEAQFRLMKPSAYFINTARGALVHEPALLKALTQGWIAGAALDVFATEPLPADDPLRQAPNTILAPHQASFARDTGGRVSVTAAQAIVDLLEGRPPALVVDPGVLQSPELRATLSAPPITPLT